ncbi:hypothetical protein RchiOBHm_Chr2g0106401 [Rosa chinensis]|uniref:Uncharacterized protein n=1 Tax=Rosa chinensis TaxID=74649 RepID=A0A2P6RNN8_ROSCH|nr:hypothetical protein RchiOBHm_Chr2g0106401 [Rosa chinensis]
MLNRAQARPIQALNSSQDQVRFSSALLWKQHQHGHAPSLLIKNDPQSFVR